MRRKREAVLSFESCDDGLPRVVREYRARYRGISQVLDANDEILTAVHRDLQSLSEGDSTGREGDYTSENILRALVVQHIEGLPFRETVIRIGGEAFLQDFLRMRKKPVMDFTFLDKCFLGDPAADVATGQRTARPPCGRTGGDHHQRHSHGHDGRGIEHPLSYGCVAAVGHVARGVASVEPGAGNHAEKRAAPLSRSEDQATVSVRDPLHAQQERGASAEGQGNLSHADRADGVDRGDCRGFLCPGRVARR